MAQRFRCFILTALASAVIVAAVASLSIVTTAAQSGAAPPAAAPVIGGGNFSPVSNDLDKTLDFYALLGMKVAPAAAPGPRPWDTRQPPLRLMHGVPDMMLRFVPARVQGLNVGVEPIEFMDPSRKAVHPRVQDPGAATLILIVRDIDPLLARLKQAGVPVLTKGGLPVEVDDAAGKARAVLVRDPDGHFIELRQIDPLPQTTVAADSNIVSARVRLTVADTDASMRVYRDLLGFQPVIGKFSADKKLRALTGVSGGQVRLTTALVPGSQTQMEFLEFKGIDRRPVRPRIQDPGATRFQLRVREIGPVVSALTAAGGTDITTGGGPVTLLGNVTATIVTDPDGLFWWC